MALPSVQKPMQSSVGKYAADRTIPNCELHKPSVGRRSDWLGGMVLWRNDVLLVGLRRVRAIRNAWDLVIGSTSTANVNHWRWFWCIAIAGRSQHLYDFNKKHRRRDHCSNIDVCRTVFLANRDYSRMGVDCLDHSILATKKRTNKAIHRSRGSAVS